MNLHLCYSCEYTILLNLTAFDKAKHMKIAIICDWLVTYAGSERVLAEILTCYPEADLFAVVDFLPAGHRGFIKNKPVTTTFIQQLPFAKKYYRQYLPWMPLAIEQLDVSNYDLIISSSHAVAKGVITGPNQLHVSYVHSPMRYAWDLQHQYLQESGLDRGIKGFIAKKILHKMRIWDQRTANGVDHYLANSNYIARRIEKIYRRDAEVVYPPVDIHRFTPKNDKENFYLTASRFVPYKKIDLIVETFSTMPDKKLIVVGTGPDFNKIKSQAASHVELLGYQPDEKLIDLMQRAKAFVFAAEEDFGITPLEAQSCGTPVIAFGKGGTLETMRGLDQENPTAVFFAEQTVSSLTDAIKKFEANANHLTPENCRKNAERFAPELFQQKFKKIISEKTSGVCA